MNDKNPDNKNGNYLIYERRCPLLGPSINDWVIETLNKWISESIIHKWYDEINETPRHIKDFNATKSTILTRLISLNWNCPGEEKCPERYNCCIKNIDVPTIFEKKDLDGLFFEIPNAVTLQTDKLLCRNYPLIPNYPMIVCQLSLIRKDKEKK
jgi:hypothetical protein